MTNNEVLSYVRSQWPEASDINDNELLSYSRDQAPQLFTMEHQQTPQVPIQTGMSSNVKQALEASGQQAHGNKLAKALQVYSLFQGGGNKASAGDLDPVTGWGGSGVGNEGIAPGKWPDSSF